MLSEFLPLTTEESKDDKNTLTGTDQIGTAIQQQQQQQVEEVEQKSTTTSSCSLQRNSASLEQDLFGLTKVFAQRLKTAADLSYIAVFGSAHSSNRGDAYTFYRDFRDLNDRVVVAKPMDDQVCHVCFAATRPWNPLEYPQINDLSLKQVGTSDCKVREGFYDSVFSNDYYEDYRRAVDDCVRTCTSGSGSGSSSSSNNSGGENPHGCPVIINGLSAGGSSAVVAAIDLRHYNPVTFNFGGMRTVHLSSNDDDDDNDSDAFPCNDLDRNRQLRFVNTQDGDYDQIANQWYLKDIYHLGHTILLDDDNYRTYLLLHTIVLVAFSAFVVL